MNGEIRGGPCSATALAAALDAWSETLGADAVMAGDAATQRYGPCTLRAGRRIAAAVRPASATEVAAVLEVARRYSVRLYPVSTGHNWGYGSANPVHDDCVVVDLSRMNRILDLNAEFGLVTLEPGVTQRQLHEYLEQRNLSFLVPVHGGGPHCSLMGNALERGYGITPHADHFAAVMAIEALLADGQVYRSALSELGGELIDRSFKWGLGPYLDGLFSQSGLGIVTRMTIALAPRPESTMAFFFGLKDDRDLEEAVLRVQAALRIGGGVVGSVNLMNRRRVLSMMVPYPRDGVPPGGIIPTDLLNELGRRNGVMSWMGAGALYGSRRLVNAAKRDVAHALRPLAKRLVFVNQERLSLAKSLLKAIPMLGAGRLGNVVSTLDKTLQLMHGVPSEIALPLAYWKTPELRREGTEFDPAGDGSGLIWYSPLIPMTPALVRNYVAMTEDTCTRHGIEPLITLTSLSDRCFDSTVPILFDRADDAQTLRAHACYTDLVVAGCAQGFTPYRASIESMDMFVRRDATFWHMANSIKKALDPDNLISPGRYS